MKSKIYFKYTLMSQLINICISFEKEVEYMYFDIFMLKIVKCIKSSTIEWKYENQTDC